MAHTHLLGLKVVRGPNWAYSDQDGGEGHVGTIISCDEGDIEQQILRPRMISVRWESGLQAQYRAGPQGSHDLRVVDNSVTGVRHPGVSCGGTGCTVVGEICGIRWKCAICRVDLCTKCVLDETPHHADHAEFQRYDNSEITDAPTIPIWSVNGPQSRIKMIGMPGFYHPEAFSTLDNPLASMSNFPFRSPTNLFCNGDRVQINPDSQQIERSEDVAKVLGATGTVISVGDSEVQVHFAAMGIKLRLNPEDLIKLNNFSINQTIRVRDDEETIREIEESFGIACNNLRNQKLQGAVGRVMGFNPLIPGELFIQFDNHKIYNWMNRSDSLPSSWLEQYEATQPVLDEELLEFDRKAVLIFNRAVYSGNLRIAKLLFARCGMNVVGQNADGLTAVQIACQQNHPEMVQWLLTTIGIDTGKSDTLGQREIHHAVMRCNPKILKMILRYDIDMDSRTKSGQTALDIAVDNEFLECARVLIDNGAQVNIQDCNGDTPLHRALQFGSSKMIEILISSLRVDWNLQNKNDFTVFHLAVYSKVFKLIEYFLKKDKQSILFNWVSNNGETVAYYASKCRNAEAIKLMIDGSGEWRKNLLERKIVKLGMTPFLHACSMKCFSVIELLVAAGSDLKASDNDGNTAIILAASSTSKDVIPSKENSPGVFKIYEDGTKKNKYPIMPLLAYLIQNGCGWEAVNKAGKKASDILLEKGYPSDLIQHLDAMAAKWKRWMVGPNGCMGREGECDSKLDFRLSCPHRATLDLCSPCFSLAFKQKCGCKEENVLLITIPEEAPAATQADVPADPSRNELGEPSKESTRLDILQWVNDGTEKGHVKDQEGNTFFWNKRKQKEGYLVYRCQFQPGGRTSCPGTARRFVSKEEEGFTILLATPHAHSPTAATKKELVAKRSRPNSDGDSAGPSGCKQMRTPGAI